MNCPNCGAKCPLLSKHIKVATCPSCGTTLMLRDAQLASTGQLGEMHDESLLFGLSDHVESDRTQPPFWVTRAIPMGADSGMSSVVLIAPVRLAGSSVDEGGVVRHVRLRGDRMPEFAPSFEIGQALPIDASDFTVTEVETARCFALRGQFDEVLQVGNALA